MTSLRFSLLSRFRLCLKMNHSAHANLVGRIFFNAIKTPCFVLATSKVCAEKTWWGKCLEWKEQKQAIWREPISY